MGDFEKWNEARGREIIDAHKDQSGAALPVLQALQRVFGYVPRPAVPRVAEALNLSRAEVHGVVTFYHDFRDRPPGTHVLKLCRAEACQSMGADALAARAREELKVEWGETTADGRVTLEPVFCLGLCACAPAAMFDDRVIGALDNSRLDALMEQARLR